MKFALSAIVSVALSGLVAEANLGAEYAALDAEYKALEPQLAKLGLSQGGLNKFGININPTGINAVPFITGLNGLNLDLNAMRSAGYASLADQLERVGNMGLAAGKKGLVAIKKLLASNLVEPALLAEAQAAGGEAAVLGQQAAQVSKTDLIAQLRASGFQDIAASLEANPQGGNAFNFLSSQPTGPAITTDPYYAYRPAPQAAAAIVPKLATPGAYYNARYYWEIYRKITGNVTVES